MSFRACERFKISDDVIAMAVSNRGPFFYYIPVAHCGYRKIAMPAWLFDECHEGQIKQNYTANVVSAVTMCGTF